MNGTKNWRHVADVATQSSFLLYRFRLWLAKNACKTLATLRRRCFSNSFLSTEMWTKRKRRCIRLLLGVTLCHPKLPTRLQTSWESFTYIDWPARHVCICQKLDCWAVKVMAHFSLDRLTFLSDVCGDCVHEWVYGLHTNLHCLHSGRRSFTRL